jgi:N-acetylmuramoyl-L-alanine amidase
MSIFNKSMVSTMSIFTAASLAFPVFAYAAPLNRTSVTNYTVQSGDSLWEIAHAYDISLDSLLAANTNIPVFNLQIGTNLIIPLGKTESSSQQSRASSHISHTTAHYATHASAKPYIPVRATYSSTAAANAYTQNLYWMSHVIHAEASGEPIQAQIAVGDVVMHRLETSGQYKSVHDVVFAVENGHYQFTCVANGYIYSTPNSAAVTAAKEVLNQHVDVVPGASVFFNPVETPSSSWVWSQPRITRIGDFIFSR